MTRGRFTAHTVSRPATGSARVPLQDRSAHAPWQPIIEVAITVDPEIHAQVVAAADEEGTSVSAWMTNVAWRALLVRNGLRAVAEWEAERGALTDAELAAARRRVAQAVGHSAEPGIGSSIQTCRIISPFRARE